MLIADIMNFSAGEVHVSVEDILSDRQPIVHDFGSGPIIYLPRPTSQSLSDYIFTLLLIRDIVQAPNVSLFLPYLPYSRQDRKTASRNPVSLRVFADVLATAKFDKIYTLDVHSNEATAFIRNLVNIDITGMFRRDLRLDLNTRQKTLVVPDTGAAKRLMYIEQYFQDVIYVIKQRNVDTGHINIKEVIGDPRSVDLIIVDDICDGGRTFIEIANRLKGYSSLSLYTTHGIYSQGLQQLIDAGFSRFYTTDSFRHSWEHSFKTTFNCLDILETAVKAGVH